MRHRFEVIVPLVLILGLTATPAIWAIDVRNHPSAINPVAGSNEMQGGPGGRFGGNGKPDPFRHGPMANVQPNNQPGNRLSMSGGPFGEQANSEIISYLEKNRNGAKYLLATFGAQAAASFITTTGEPVLPIGGFDGQDPTPTLDEFKAMIKNGELRYVQVGGGMGGHGNNEGSSEISTWVTTNCTLDVNAPVSGSLYLCTPVK